MPESWSGRRIGDFIIEERIARGGTSTIYRARQASVNRYVAVKIIDLGEDIEDRDAMQRDFDREVALIAQLEHIHIVPVYGYGIIDDRHAYVAMRLMGGGSLFDHLRSAPMPVERVVQWVDDIGQALDYAHRKGFMHGDVKPGNILLDNGGHAYLSDFGVAHFVAEVFSNALSPSQSQLPLYLAPERLRGEEGDFHADIYSLGAILYHLLTGSPPFPMDESGLGGWMTRQLQEEPPPPRSLNPQITPALEGLILRALRKNPADRFTSIPDMMRTFHASIGRSTLEWKLDATTRQRRRPTPRRRWWWIAPPLGVVIALTAVLLLFRPPDLPAIQPPIVMLDDERATIDSVMPTSAEIERARAVINGGFIAYLNCTLDNVLDASRSRYARETATVFGLPIRVYDAQNNLYTQLNQFEEARLSGARAFILCPVAFEGLEAQVAALQEDGIPLAWVTLSDHAYGVKLDADNYAVGQRIGMLASDIFLQERGGQGSFIIVSRGRFPASQSRVQGILDTMRERAPEVVFWGEFAANGRDLRRAVQDDLTALLLDERVPDAVLSTTDAGAYGATDALNNAAISPEDVFMVSANGEPFALDLLRSDSFLRGTVAIDRETSGQLLIYGLVKLLAGAPVPEYLTYPAGEMITETNVESFAR